MSSRRAASTAGTSVAPLPVCHSRGSAMRKLWDATGRGWTRLKGWLGRADLVVLLACLSAVIAVLGFLKIADEVMAGEYGPADERVVRSLREPGDPADPLGPRWLEEG